MARFLIVLPAEQRWHYASCSMEAALKLAGLERGKVDHGPVMKDVHIIVYEDGLFEERDDMFCIGRHLYAGGAVVYQVGAEGDMIDFDHGALTHWIMFGNRRWAIDMVARQVVERPALRVNGEEIWAWPNPAQDEETRAALAKRIGEADTAIIGDVVIRKIK